MRCLAQAGEWGAGAVAVAVVEAGGVLARYGDEETTFAWASVTKLVTSLAVLVAVEEGTVALDDPAGPPGATLAHLLAHASGCAPDDVSRALAPPGPRRGGTRGAGRGVRLAGRVGAGARPRRCVATVPRLGGPPRTTEVALRTTGGRSNTLRFRYR